MPVPFLFYRRHIGDFRRHKTFTIMLHEEVKHQIEEFLRTPSLAFEDQSDLECKLKCFLKRKLDIQQSGRKWFKLTGYQKKSVSVITLRTDGESVPLELIYRSKEHKWENVRIRHFWDKVRRMELLHEQEKIDGFVLFITNNRRYMKEIENGKYSPESHPELPICGTYELEWHYLNGNTASHSDQSDDFFYLLTEPNLK